jgi:hypothetical protein
MTRDRIEGMTAAATATTGSKDLLADEDGDRLGPDQELHAQLIAAMRDRTPKLGGWSPACLLVDDLSNPDPCGGGLKDQAARRAAVVGADPDRGARTRALGPHRPVRVELDGPRGLGPATARGTAASGSPSEQTASKVISYTFVPSGSSLGAGGCSGSRAGEPSPASYAALSLTRQ